MGHVSYLRVHISSVLNLSIGADAIVGWVAGLAHEMKRTAHSKVENVKDIYHKMFKNCQKDYVETLV